MSADRVSEPEQLAALLHASTGLTDVALGDIDEPSVPLRSSLDQMELERLADDMARRGLLQPIGLIPSTRERPYEIVWGHRRYLAAQRLAWPTIPARIFPQGTSVVEARIAENEIREDLTYVDQGRYCDSLMREGWSLERVAHVVRRSPEWVRARVELLRYPVEVQDAVATKGITLSVARELAQIDYEPYRRELLAEAIRSGATTRVVATWRAGYHADRDRIVSNDITRDEILARREELTVTVACEWCRDVTRLEHTRMIRLCTECTRQFFRAQAQEATAQSTADPTSAQHPAP